MIKFSKAEMMEEFREVVYQFARSASYCLAPESGYSLLFDRKPKSFDDVLHFMNPEVNSRTYDEPFSIDRFQATRSIEQFYDYGLLGIRCMPPVDRGGANEWTFAYGMVWDASNSFLISESCNGDPVQAHKCLYAGKAFFARLVLDGGDRTYLYGDEGAPSDMLTISEVAILAGLDDRTVRNATSKSAANRLETTVVDSNIFIPREAAKAWLGTKRGFIPTRVGDDLPSIAVLNDSFIGQDEAGDYVRKTRERMNLAPLALLEKAKLDAGEKWLTQIETGEIPHDEEKLTALGTALGLNGTLFALRMLEAKQKDDFSNLQRRIYRETNA